jgi:primosomal protein N' (replication factor Y)
MSNSQTILRIAIASPLRNSFDYLPPQGWDGKALPPGIRIKVPFGHRNTVGVLLEIDNETEVDQEKLKPVIEILDQKPLLPPALMQLNFWASDYYHHSIGEVILNNLPKLLQEGKAAELREPKINLPKQDETQSIQLNQDQQHAVNIINDNNGFKVFLLDGVTGSGKTEVYLQVIAEILNADKQALVLVPEIGLTPQTVARFQNRFKVNIAVMHSRLTPKERLNAWLMAKKNIAKIIIGTRSAIFVPLAKPGIIILDEEHDLSFRQQSGLRYSARDLATVRGKLENIPIILGSATPSLESLRNAKSKRYIRLQLLERAGSAIHPSYNLIDMRNQKLVEGLSEKLIQKIENHLQQNGQILIFINRRGYSPTLLCQSCGLVIECNRCDARMTLHQKPHYLHCHHCGATKPIPKICPECNSDQLVPLGFGTERVEEALKNLFPDASLLRIDRDTVRTRDAMHKMLEEIHNNQCQILIGTQILAKGHHFPNVTMVAILNADNGLLSSDFRAEEYTAQLIMQVSGRAGRAEKPGEVYIQTYNPHHPLLLQLINFGYHSFAMENLLERQKANLPPFAYFALFRAEARNASKALEFLQQLKNKTATIQSNIKLLGPIPAPMQRKAGYYRAQLLISSKNRNSLHDLLDFLAHHIETLKPSSLRWSLDIDPMDMF